MIKQRILPHVNSLEPWNMYKHKHKQDGRLNMFSKNFLGKSFSVRPLPVCLPLRTREEEMSVD